MKKIIKYILSKTRILKPLKVFQKNKIVIFNYHRIRDNSMPVHFDETVFGPDKNRFREEMEWLKNETRILTEDEMVDIVYNNKPIKGICSMVTFDDGYIDNFKLAYPILKELSIPATFFIPTHHMIERKVGWWDMVAYLIKQTQLDEFNFQDKKYVLSDPRELIKEFIIELKSTDAQKIDDYLLRLSHAVNVPMPDQKLQSSELMTWDQLKLMSDNGMTIGSHSHDHSILSKQDDITLKKQLRKSIEILEFYLGKKVQSIAYPVGGYEHFNDSTKKISKELGFKLGFSYLTGINQCEHIDPFDVKRISVDRGWINLDMALAFPNYFLNKC